MRSIFSSLSQSHVFVFCRQHGSHGSPNYGEFNHRPSRPVSVQSASGFNWALTSFFFCLSSYCFTTCTHTGTCGPGTMGGMVAWWLALSHPSWISWQVFPCISSGYPSFLPPNDMQVRLGILLPTPLTKALASLGAALRLPTAPE